MSALPLQSIDPFRQASLGAEYEGELPFERMPRLAALLAEKGVGSVRYRLRFSQPSSRRFRLEGELDAVVALPCQRCFRPSRHRLSVPLAFELVETEAELDRLDESQEGLLIEDERINLPSLIEDELLLALPVVARHVDPSDCEGSDWQRWMDAERRREPVPAPKGERSAENPFAVLAALKGGDGADGET